MSDTDAAPKKFVARVEDEFRADVAADVNLAEELVTELIKNCLLYTSRCV